MADALQSIQEEILSAITSRTDDAQVLSMANVEIALASGTDALDGKGSALNVIYNIWQSNPTKRGNKNKSNSWIAYGLGLTTVRPTSEPLPLRRAFARAGFPDIDSDFEDARREEVTEHLVEKYGRDKVGNIGTYGTLHMKSVVRGLVKVIDAAGSYHKGLANYTTDNDLKGDEIIASLPKPQGSKIKWTTDDGKEVEIKTVRDAYTYVPHFRQYMDKFPDILNYSEHIEGISSNFSTHASGVIIANEPLSGLAPLRPVTKKNWKGEKVPSFSTQLAYEDCEAVGLIKFDILAIKMLSIVKGCVELIKQNFDIDIDIENVPLEDKKTYQMFQTGNLVGVFQCEGFGMQSTCKNMRVSNFDDIMAAISLYRPGPMVNIPSYIARKHGEQKIDYFHPSIEPFVKPFLQRTYGICIYQEQLMQVCMAVGKLSITDGYGIIKGTGKKLLDVLAKYKKAFLKGAVENGVPLDVADQYWETRILPFASYGFNSAHACAYAYNAYLTAYLKANYPMEFMVASLNVEAVRKKWKKVLVLERDATRNGIQFLKKDINTATMNYEIVSRGDSSKGIRPQIRPSILCQGLSNAAAESIVANAPYVGLRDFAMRTTSSVDTSSMTSLADAGFFPKAKANKLVEEFEKLRTDLKKAAKKGVPSQDMFE